MRQSADRVALLEFAHVEADHAILVAEQRLRQRPRQLGLADPGGTQEQGRANRPVGVGQPGAGPPDRFGDRDEGLVLADDLPVEMLLQLQQPFAFLLGQLGHRDPGGTRDDLGDVVGGHLRHVGGAAGAAVELAAEPVDLALQPARLLVVLIAGRGVLVPLQYGQALLQRAAVRRDDRAAQPYAGARLIDQVDCLVGQEPAGDVPVGQLGGRAARDSNSRASSRLSKGIPARFGCAGNTTSSPDAHNRLPCRPADRRLPYCLFASWGTNPTTRLVTRGPKMASMPESCAMMPMLRGPR
jgi:hypothetical protein